MATFAEADGFSLAFALVRGLTGIASHSLVVEQQHALFRHVADGIARALAADAR
jgi:hypothetical protein